MKKNVTPKKGITTRIFKGKKYYYVGRTLYQSKAIQIKDKVREMGMGVAMTKSSHQGFVIWSTSPVNIPLMEVGSYDLFMEGEYNPIRKERRTGKRYWRCRFCETENKSTGAGLQTCEKCKRPKASYQKMYLKGSRP